ncbi:5-methylcytosine-specific restriction endonuclease McrA [Anaerotaenia torta]|uniref:HNH endonuclease n=1 Tax=Anaerotaenia torta TaxID=433293 RepID=UPI003D1DAEAE
MIERKCLQCGKDFKTHQCQINRGGGKFCSVSCGTTYRNIHDNPVNKPGVKEKISKNHAEVPWLIKYCSNGYKGQRVASYRLKAFRAHGKKCNRCGSKEKLEVHHKDRDHHNNEIENLEVLCKTCHTKLHYGEYIQARDPVTGRFIRMA